MDIDTNTDIYYLDAQMFIHITIDSDVKMDADEYYAIQFYLYSIYHNEICSYIMHA